MNARQKLPHCVGFTESPAAGLRRCGLCCGISVGCEALGQILVEPFAAGAIMWSGGRTPSPSSWAGAQRCDAMGGTACVSRSSSHRPPLPSRARPVHGWAFGLTCLHAQLQCLVARS